MACLVRPDQEGIIHSGNFPAPPLYVIADPSEYAAHRNPRAKVNIELPQELTTSSLPKGEWLQMTSLTLTQTGKATPRSMFLPLTCPQQKRWMRDVGRRRHYDERTGRARGCADTYLFRVELGGLGVDDGGSKLEMKQTEKLSGARETRTNAIGIAQPPSASLTLHKSKTLAPTTHCSIKPLSAKLTILEAS